MQKVQKIGRHCGQTRVQYADCLGKNALHSTQTKKLQKMVDNGLGCVYNTQYVQCCTEHVTLTFNPYIRNFENGIY